MNGITAVTRGWHVALVSRHHTYYRTSAVSSRTCPTICHLNYLCSRTVEMNAIVKGFSNWTFDKFCPNLLNGGIHKDGADRPLRPLKPSFSLWNGDRAAPPSDIVWYSIAVTGARYLHASCSLRANSCLRWESVNCTCVYVCVFVCM